MQKIANVLTVSPPSTPEKQEHPGRHSDELQVNFESRLRPVKRRVNCPNMVQALGALRTASQKTNKYTNSSSANPLPYQSTPCLLRGISAKEPGRDTGHVAANSATKHRDS